MIKKTNGFSKLAPSVLVVCALVSDVRIHGGGWRGGRGLFARFGAHFREQVHDNELSIGSEITGTSMIKKTNGFSKLAPSVLVVCAYGFC
jgi:multidrug transporter EmrE-like cation transporter